MEELSRTLITLGGLFLLGLATDALGRKTHLPRVTLLLLFGLAIGPVGFDVLPDHQHRWFPLVSHVALAMVGFLLGGSLTLSQVRQHGRAVLWISGAVVSITAVVVVTGLRLMEVPWALALVLAGIAPATAPAATADVVHEARASGPFSKTLLTIVAVDDAWGVMIFSLMLATAQVLQGNGGGIDLLAAGFREILGAILVGGAIGLPMAYLSGRVRPGEPTLAEALGAVFLCCGLALWLEVSFLLAALTLGAVVANLATHHTRPFHAIEDVEWPFMILFFVFAGASLEPDSSAILGSLGVAYVLFRAAGRLAGAWLGSVASRAEPTVRRWMGVALMPQAGIAVGMALVACQRLPELREIVLPTVIAATVVFEIIGPVLTRLALTRVGEIGLKS